MASNSLDVLRHVLHQMGNPFKVLPDEGAIRSVVFAKLQGFLAVLGLALMVGGGSAWLMGEGTQPPPPATSPAASLKKPLTDSYGDPLPAGAIARLGTVRFRHPNVNALVFSPDGRYLVSGSEYLHAFRFWEPATGKLRGEIKTPGARFRSLTFSPDGKQIAALGSLVDHRGKRICSAIRFWDALTFQELRTIKYDPKVDEGYPPPLCTFTPDGKTLLTSVGRDYSEMSIWDVKTGTELLRYRLSEKRVGSLALSPDGTLVAGSTGDKSILLWEWQTGKPARKLPGGEDVCNSLAFSPDGKILAGASYEGGISVWDLGTGRLRPLVNSRDLSEIGGLAFSPDGKMLAAATLNSSTSLPKTVGVFVWDPQTGQKRGELKSSVEGVHRVAFSPDGTWIGAVSGFGPRIYVWEARSGREVAGDVSAHDQTVLRVSASASGLVASASDDHTVRLWDMATGRTRHKLPHGSWVRSLSLSPDGGKLVSGCQDGRLRLWDTQSGKLIYTLPGDRPIAVGFTADGGRFLSLDERLFLVTWDVATGKAVSECQLHPGGVEAFDPENSSIVQRLRETNAAFSPDGKLLLLSWADFRIFEVSSAKEVRRFPNPGLPGMAVFNPGSMVVSPNNQYLLVVTGTKLKEIKGPDGRIEETWESPQLCLWDLSTGRLCRQKALLEAVAGLVAFRPDSRVYAVASWAPDCSFNKISLFDVVSGKELRSFDGLSSRVDSLTFTPDGNRLVTGMNDSSVLLWDVGNK